MLLLFPVVKSYSRFMTIHFSRRGRRIVLALLAVLSAIAIVALPAPGRPLPGEIRGVWLTNVDSEVLFSKEATREAIARLADLNFNTVYPTMWQGGYTLFESQVAEHTFGVALDPTPGLQGRDVLQEIIDEARERDMAVMPWLEFGFLAPADSELVARHPEWVTRRQDGTEIEVQGEYERVWLNPFHPGVQNFILSLVQELVTRYDIDGIQFDDHFSLPAEFGYDDYTLGLYERRYRFLPASEEQRQADWTRWRANRIANFKQRLYKTVKEIDPECVVSLSPNPLGFAYQVHLQNWFDWVSRGSVDEVVLQVYRQNLADFVRELDRPEIEAARHQVPVAIGILAGLKNRGTPIEDVEAQVLEVRKRGLNGVSFFFYESLWKWSDEPPQAREDALARMFPVPMSRQGK